MTSPRVASGRLSILPWGRHGAARVSTLLITAAAALLNAWVSAVATGVPLIEWRWAASLAGMAAVATSAIVTVVRTEPKRAGERFPRPVHVAVVVAIAAGWAYFRLAEHRPSLEAWMGKPIGNAPLEIALIVFAGSRLYRWPESFLVATAIASYASYVFLPESVASEYRDMPVTFSFVLFACLVVTWWFGAWTRRDAAPRQRADPAT